MALIETSRNLWRGASTPGAGEVGRLLTVFGAEVIVGHPTFHNAATIGQLLGQGIGAASSSFGGRKVAFLVTDGTLTRAAQDATTLDTAVEEARSALDRLPEAERARVLVVATPYEGYRGDTTPGKGSALKLLFDEMGETAATFLVVLDGDLRNDMGQWQSVFARVERAHRDRYGDRPLFVTARYARHFIDASITRFIVGPLTTLMGTYVPGGISGDIALSASAVAREREALWTPARRQYGTDIATTFDNIADPQTVIWEVYLGAKLHDITDEAKLSAMPGQVISAALERLRHWQGHDGRVLDVIRGARALARPVAWGPAQTGIEFVDPGATDAFDIDVKMTGLIRRFDEFAGDIDDVVGARLLPILRGRVAALAEVARAGESAPLRFLEVDEATWIDIVYRSVAYVLRGGAVERAGRCLNYLYTAAFLEFVKDRLLDLGLTTTAAVRSEQRRLAVPADRAHEFYAERVDAVAEALARRFFENRTRILRYL